MDTVEVGSERELARAALGLCPHPAEVLVGGLGLGFTAREVLADPRVNRLTVVEIEPAVVEWMGSGLIPDGSELVNAERVEIVVADVRSHIPAVAGATYDLVLLDVDNGPDFLVHESNAAIYRPAFLAEVRRVLNNGGVVVVWSMNRSPAVESALTESFGNARAIGVPVTLQGHGEEYWLHLATR
jgi:spermidine synthase